MELRPYAPADCAAMAELFYNTVHTVNARDYTPEQLCAWATGEVDLAEWDRSFQAHHTLVAVEGEQIVGFGDLDVERGYLDRLYVHKDHQGEGIATTICDALEQSVPAVCYTTHASITARRFFERRGYRTILEQNVERRGVTMQNFVMEKQNTH